MCIAFVPAQVDDATTISRLRQAIWSATYRGIYPDEVIDGYDYGWHEQRDLARIRDPLFHVYLICCDERPAGYLILRDGAPVLLHSLYLLETYQNRGIGRMALSLVNDFCLERGRGGYRCFCNAHNLRAREFYAAMGGVITGRDEGHENRQEDQLTFSFAARSPLDHRR